MTTTEHSLNEIKNNSPNTCGELVTWSESYSTGIEIIDGHHKELFDLTNKLFTACVDGGAQSVFKDSMRDMVDYVNFHFTAEIKLLEQINYPDYINHKKQHDALIKKIIDTAKSYTDSKTFVPHSFVRTLKDWILAHIAVSDKAYSAYVVNQKKLGLLSDQQISDFLK